MTITVTPQQRLELYKAIRHRIRFIDSVLDDPRLGQVPGAHEEVKQEKTRLEELERIIEP